MYGRDAACHAYSGRLGQFAEDMLFRYERISFGHSLRNRNLLLEKR